MWRDKSVLGRSKIGAFTLVFSNPRGFAGSALHRTSKGGMERIREALGLLTDLSTNINASQRCFHRNIILENFSTKVSFICELKLTDDCVGMFLM